MATRVLSGIKPSSDSLHLGNYFGAVKQHIKLQEKYEAYFFIADLHALTTVHNKKQLETNILDIALDYLALGLNPEKTIFFRQSDVPAHPYLAIILNNLVPLGLLKRAHAYKDKLNRGETDQSINAGLFFYPVLMTADILLYQPKYVPVGEDQVQHIEIMRDIAAKFNHTYGQTFVLPEALLPSKQEARLIGTDGQKKMSKSIGNVISIFADEATIKKQIMSCFTDPNRIHPTDPGRVEGNPVFVYHDLINQNKKEVKELKARYRQGQVGDVEVKQKLFQAFMTYFEKPRRLRRELYQNKDKVKKILASGAVKASKTAQKTLIQVINRVGL